MDNSSQFDEVDSMEDYDLGYDYPDWQKGSQGPNWNGDCRKLKTKEEDIIDRDSDMIRCSISKYIYPCKSLPCKLEEIGNTNNDKKRQLIFKKTLRDYCENSPIACSQTGYEGEIKPIDPICFEINQCSVGNKLSDIPTNAQKAFKFFQYLMDVGLNDQIEKRVKKSRINDVDKSKANRMEIEMIMIKEEVIDFLKKRSISQNNNNNTNGGARKRSRTINKRGGASDEDNNVREPTGRKKKKKFKILKSMGNVALDLVDPIGIKGLIKKDAVNGCTADSVTTWEDALSIYELIENSEKGKKISGTGIAMSKSDKIRTAENLEENIKIKKECLASIQIELNPSEMGQPAVKTNVGFKNILKGAEIFKRWKMLNRLKDQLRGRGAMNAMRNLTFGNLNALRQQQNAAPTLLSKKKKK